MSSDPAEAFNRLLAEEPQLAREEAEGLPDALARAGVTYGGAAMRSFLRPQLVQRAAWRHLTRSADRLLRLAERLARVVFDGDVARLAEFLGLPEAERPYLALDPGPPDVVLSRLDALLTASGPRFLEVNSDAPAGFGYGDRMAEVLQATRSFRRFSERVRVEYEPSGPGLVAAVLAAARDAGLPIPRVAIVDWAEVPTRADQELLREQFERAGVACRLADPRELGLRAGRLVAGGETIDVVYRRAVLSEVLARESEVRPFLEAYRSRAALFVSSFRCRLSEDKALFAILTDEAYAHLMDAEERALVASCLPWTRRVEQRRTRFRDREVELVPFVVGERARFVLKPCHAYGGQSVLLGDETDAAGWAAAVEAALAGAWVVQEKLAIPEEEFPVVEGGELRFERLKVNTNPFYARGSRCGAVTRVSRSSVINVSAGGGSVPTFVVG